MSRTSTSASDRVWNDIEIVKSSSSLKARARSIESSGLSLPGHVLCRSSGIDRPSGPGNTSSVSAGHGQPEVDRNGHRSARPTRNNTSAVMNGSPVHARAGQLALVRRWIAIETDLLKRLAAFPRVARILKARIITDIVSFCDCLVTRPVSARPAGDGRPGQAHHRER